MKRRVIIGALASVALAATAPALAKPGGGGGGGHGKSGANASGTIGGDIGAGIGRGAGANVGGTIGTSTDIGRGGISGGANAGGSATAGGRVGAGSAIDMRGSASARSKAGSAVNVGTQVGANAQLSTQLTGVTTGMTVVDSGGATIGTVTNVTLTGGGRVRSVQVTLTDGSRIFLSPNSLSLDGDVLATTSLTSNVRSKGADNASIQGLANASERSALNRAGVTTLTTLATGMTVNNALGANIGTVSSLVVNRSGALVGIRVALDGGGTVLIPATSLSIDGTIVTTTAVPGG